MKQWVIVDLTKEQRNENYKTHTPRYSDSSVYTEICTICGARDYTCGPDELSERPCPKKARLFREC